MSMTYDEYHDDIEVAFQDIHIILYDDKYDRSEINALSQKIMDPDDYVFSQTLSDGELREYLLFRVKIHKRGKYKIRQYKTEYMSTKNLKDEDII